MSWTQTAAIFKSTPRPETAKLLIAFITSDEFQDAMSAGGEKSAPTLSKNIDRKNRVKSVGRADKNQANQYRVWTNDRTAVDWWELQFETTLGTPQGVSPLDVYGFEDVRAL